MPVKPERPFRLASVSKTFTALAAEPGPKKHQDKDQSLAPAGAGPRQADRRIP